MEEKELSTEQSLDLIARMIAATRRNFNEKGGAMFIIWGYATIAVTLAVYAAFGLTKNHDTMWIWWALPLVGGILTWRHYRKHKKPVQTHLDKTVNYVWLAFSASTLLCMIFGFIPAKVLPGAHPSFPIILLISLLISLATAITGLVIKFRPVAAAGFAGMALSFLTFVFNGIEQLPIFAGLMLVVQVIPGHMLNAACKREARAAQGTVGAAQNGRAE